MPSANLPTDTAALSTATASEHLTHHSVVHAIVNKFSHPASPASGDFLLHDGIVYVPSSFQAAVDAAVQTYLAANGSVGNTVTIFGASSARIHPQTLAALPPNTTVLWDADTAPVNFVDGTDIWINRPAN